VVRKMEKPDGRFDIGLSLISIKRSDLAILKKYMIDQGLNPDLSE